VLVLLAIGGSVAVRLLGWCEAPGPIPNFLKLEVVNGCGAMRAGDAVMRDLQQRGFNVYRTRNAEGYYRRTQVVDRRNRTGAAARSVANALGVRPRFLGFRVGRLITPEVVVAIDSLSYPDVSVVVGTDYRRFFPNAIPLY